MKRVFQGLLLLLTVSVFSVSYSQEAPSILSQDENKSYYYEKVFEVPGKSKAELFDAIKSWVIKNVKTQSVTNTFDEVGKNSITTTPAFHAPFSSTIDFKLNIELKDGKYRLSGTSFEWVNMQGIPKKLGDYSGITLNKKNRQKILDAAEENVSAIVSSIQNVTLKKSNDW